MTTKEIAQSVLTLRNKGYVSDYGDTDYFCDATEDEVDTAYEMLSDLQANGEVAYREKYGLN